MLNLWWYIFRVSSKKWNCQVKSQCAHRHCRNASSHTAKFHSAVNIQRSHQSCMTLLVLSQPHLQSVLLIFCGCVANCYPLSGLKENIYYVTDSVCQESEHSLAGPVLRVLQGCNRSVGQAVLISGGSTGKDSAPELSQVVGRIHFSGL